MTLLDHLDAVSDPGSPHWVLSLTLTCGLISQPDLGLLPFPGRCPLLGAGSAPCPASGWGGGIALAEQPGEAPTLVPPLPPGSYWPLLSSVMH